MPLSNTTLSAIQQAGAAVFAADLELKNAVKDYAERVHAAISANPYSLGNDAMFENWKVVARLSQTLTGIEVELKKVFHLASDLLADDLPTVMQLSAPGTPMPDTAFSANLQDDMLPTDVVAKTRKAPSKRAARGPAAGQPMVPGGNAGKLLRYLQGVLRSDEFTVISQTSTAHQVGIPLGSMTAAIKRLIADAQIIAGPAGSYKLVS